MTSTKPPAIVDTAAPDPEVERHQHVMAERTARYQAFERFLVQAPTELQRRYTSLGVGRFYRDWYSLIVAPGGANGGQDNRTLQVFFGQRPFDVTRLPADHTAPAGPFVPVPGERTVSERGAMLQYSRTDRGQVLLLLRPAQTEFTTPRESEILLGEVAPRDLESPAVLERHLKWLLAYMAGTSLDGIRYPGQRWRYWVLTNCRLWREKDSGNWRPSRLFEGVFWIAKWVFTIGLSGSVLYFLQREWPLPDTVTPSIQRATAAAHQDQVELRALLERAAPTPGVSQGLNTRAAAAAASPKEGAPPHAR
ncbi:hypothetical protein [Rhodanobacter sp. FW106-PBR-R2A-1-13]|uniref:hypothetical protein n=1 Tax=Rhodanobacter sp. FW106-PBR-R2A-1-13 TaxID=3454845 RepID=UPI0034E573DB